MKLTEKNVLYLNFLIFTNIPVANIQTINKTGFMTFDPSGVLAANNTFHDISQTISTNASGQLVIKPVTVHNHLTFFIAESINSILKPMKNIRVTTPSAQNNEFKTFHHIISAEDMKKSRVINQIVISNFCTDSFKISLIY